MKLNQSKYLIRNTLISRIFIDKKIKCNRPANRSFIILFLFHPLSTSGKGNALCGADVERCSFSEGEVWKSSKLVHVTLCNPRPTLFGTVYASLTFHTPLRDSDSSKPFRRTCNWFRFFPFSSGTGCLCFFFKKKLLIDWPVRIWFSSLVVHLNLIFSYDCFSTIPKRELAFYNKLMVLMFLNRWLIQLLLCGSVYFLSFFCM